MPDYLAIPIEPGVSRIKLSIQIAIKSMITLEDNLWKELKGGYKTPYDASSALKRLERTSDKQEIDRIFEELWDELHHQGDVELASYLALPQLVRIAKNKNLFDWNVLALSATIEQQRHLGKIHHYQPSTLTIMKMD
jgi:hypothetical protein